jgi:putative ABC transport system permease protein
MLSKEFLVLVVVAILISIPLAWYAGSRWLQDFAYRVELSGWMFLVAGIIGVLIAILAVSSQAIKAAIANPVKSLRTE